MSDDNEAERRRADRYAELPRETREFLEQLRKDDIALLAESINFMRSTKTMSRFIKATFVLVFGAILAVGSVMKGWQFILEWFRTLR